MLRRLTHPLIRVCRAQWTHLSSLLADVLGLDAGSPVLPALLAQCNGDVGAAVDLYLADPSAFEAQHAGGGGRSTELASTAPEQTLRGLGITGTSSQIAALLLEAGGSVEGAAELWFKAGSRHSGDAGPSNAAAKDDADVNMMDESDEDRPPARPAVQTGQGRPPGTRGAAPSTARQPPPRQQPSAPVPAGSPPSRAIQGSQARRVGPVNNPDRSRDYVMPPSTSSSVDTDAQPAAGAHSHGSQARGARVSSNGARGRGGNNNAAAGVSSGGARDRGGNNNAAAGDDDLPFVPHGSASRAFTAGPAGSPHDFDSDASSEEDPIEPALPPSPRWSSQYGRPTMSNNRLWEDMLSTKGPTKKDWYEEEDREEDATLSLPELTYAKLRQPPTYPNNMKLLYPDLRDAKGRLYCTDPDKVPTSPQPQAMDDTPTPDDTVELGVFNVSIMPPGTKSMRPGEARRLKATKKWSKTPVVENQHKINEIVQPLLQSGVLPLSSLELVGGKSTERNHEYSHRTRAWWNNVERVAVAVLKGSPGYTELHEAWAKAGLTVHSCQKSGSWALKQGRPAHQQPRTSCLVLGYVAPEFLRALQVLAVLSHMPQNLAKTLDASRYSASATFEATQEQFAKVEVTSYLGVKKDTQPKRAEDPASGPHDDPEHTAKKRKGPSGKPPSKTTSAPMSDVKKQQQQDGASGTAAAGKKRKAPEPSAPAGPPDSAQAKAGDAKKRGANGAAGGPASPGKPAKNAKVPTGILPMELSVTFEMGEFIRTQRLCDGKVKAEDNEDKAQRSRTADQALKRRGITISWAVGELIHTLLTYGSGLFIGPDCDGQLNLCDDVHPMSSGRRASQQVPGCSPSDRVCGLTINEWASMAKGEYERLAASVNEYRKRMQTIKGQKGSFMAAINADYPKVVGGYDGADSDTANPLTNSEQDAPREVLARMLDVDAYLSSARGKQKEAEVSLELVRRAIVAFHNANLCGPSPPPLSPPVSPRRRARQDATGPRPGDAGADRHEGAGPSSSASGAPSRSLAAGPSTVQKGSVKPAAKRTVKKQRALHKVDRLPMTSRLNVGLILAAEKLSGNPILLRDSRDWIARVRCEDSTGSTVTPCSEKELPATEYSLGSLLDSVGLPYDYPMAPKPEQLQSVPKKYQLQGLAWMIAREQKRDALKRGLLQLHPFWVQFVTKDGYVFYLRRYTEDKKALLNVITKRFIPATGSGELPQAPEIKAEEAAPVPGASVPAAPKAVAKPPHGMRPKQQPQQQPARKPQPVEEKQDKNGSVSTCGGFLCDEMGLGKTLESLMLILSNPPPPGWAVGGADYEVPKDGEPVPIKATVIIVPSTLLNQWQDEIEGHVKPNVLKWGVFNGSDGSDKGAHLIIDAADGTIVRGRVMRQRSGKAVGASGPDSGSAAAGGQGADAMRRPFLMLPQPRKEDAMIPISELDIVFMTYEQLRSENIRRSSIRHYGFWRIMLDEAQMVGNISSVAAEVASDIIRRQAWVITGTPINSKLDEIMGLLSFLNCEPFIKDTFWKSNIQGCYEDRTLAGLSSMRGLLRGLMLRRTKAQVDDQLRLPLCHREDKYVTMTGPQRNVYDHLATEFRRTMAILARHYRYNAQNQGHRYFPRAYTSKATALLTALRQTCCHPTIASHQVAERAVANARLSAREAQGRLVMQANSNFEEAMFEHYTQRTVKVFAELLDQGNVDRIIDAWLALLTEVQACLQLAEMYDVRQAVRRRTSEGAPNMVEDAVEQTQESLRERIAAIDHELATEGGLALEATLFTDPVESLVQVNPAANPVAEAPVVQPDAQQAPAAVAANAMDGDPAGVAAAEGGPALPDAADAPMEAYLLTFFGVRERRPYGALPEGVFSAEHVLAVLPELHGRTPQMAQALQEAAQEEVDKEKEETEEAQRDRRKRWRRLELDVMVLALDVLREKLPKGCVTLAYLIERAQALQQREHGGPARGVGADKRTRDMAILLWGLQQRVSALRVELGMSSVSNLPSEDRAAAQALMVAAQESDDESTSSDSDDDDSEPESDDERRVATRSGRRPRERVEAAARAKTAVSVEHLLDRESMVRRVRQVHADGAFHAQQRNVAGAEAAAVKAYKELPHKLNKEIAELAALAALGQAPPAAGGAVAASAGPGGAADMPADEDGGGSAAMDVDPPGSTVKPESDESVPAGPAVSGDSPAASAAGSQPANAAVAALLKAAAEVDKKDAQEGAGEDNKCPICLDVPEVRVVTKCGHMFCSDCFKQLLDMFDKAKGAPCPHCRKPIKDEDIYETMDVEQAEQQALERLREKNGGAEHGAKIELLLKTMVESDPEDKALVVSSWGRLLRLVQFALEEHGIKYASLVGGKAEDRSNHLATFKHDDQCRVLLLQMSHSSGAAGLTLTEANRVYIMDPPMNPGLEAQVAARVHRLGQTRETRVIRIIAQKSVEQKVLEYQRSRLALMARQQQRQDAAGAANGAAAGSGAAGAGAGANAAAAQGVVAGPGGAGAASGAGDSEADLAAEDGELGMQLASEDMQPNTLVRFFEHL